MKHDELLDMWEKDCKIDEQYLNTSSSDIPKLHSKYLRILIEAKARKMALLHKIEEVRKELEIYYSGQASAEVYKQRPFPLQLKTKSAIEQHVNTDPKMVGLLEKIEYQDVIVECTEFIMKQIHQQSFIIKNMIEFMRFREGSI